MINQIYIHYFSQSNDGYLSSEIGGLEQLGQGWRMSVECAMAAAVRKSSCGNHPVFVVGGELVDLKAKETKATLQALPGFPNDLLYDDEFSLICGDC